MTTRSRGQVHAVFGRFAHLTDGARRDSLWCALFDTGCCAVGLTPTSAGYGLELPAPVDITHADVMIVSGPVNAKLAHELRDAYDAMPYPKWVIALGDCACDAGRFAGYPNAVTDLAKVVPVDVRLPGCPLSDEDVRSALERLRVLMDHKMEARSAGRR